jgi:glycosyltransferase involved in cell wall biosynthesis
MKFLIVAHRFHTNLYYNVTALQNAGHSVKVFVLYKGKSEFYENIDLKLFDLSLFSRFFIGISKLFRRKYLKTLFELRIESPNRKFKRETKQFKPDVILLKSYQEILSVKTLLIAKKINSKVLMHIQTNKTDVFGSKYLFKLNMKWFQSLNVTSFITPILSNYQKFKEFGIDNIYYLPFVFPVLQNKSTLSIQNNKPFKILMIGKYTMRKDQQILIDAVIELHEKGMNVELTIFGEVADIVYYNKLKEKMAAFDYDTFIHLNENIAYEEILKEY